MAATARDDDVALKPPAANRSHSVSRMLIDSWLQIAVWSSSYVISISCNFLVQIPLRESHIPDTGLSDSTTLFLTVEQSGMIDGMLQFDNTTVELAAVWVSLVPLFLVYVSFSTWLLGNQAVYYNLQWKDDGEDLPPFSVQLRVKLVNVFIGSMNYVMANYLMLVVFSSLFSIYLPECVQFLSGTSSGECYAMNESILWMTALFSLAVYGVGSVLLVCTEDFVTWFTRLLTKAGERLQANDVLREVDLDQEKFAPVFCGMFFGCWAWFVGVAINLTVQMTLARPYLNAWGVGARALLLAVMLLLFFGALAIYRRNAPPTQTPAKSRRWSDRLVEAGQKIGYKGLVWACALDVYYMVKQALPMVDRMLGHQPEDPAKMAALVVASTGIHYAIQVGLELGKQHFESQSETQAVFMIEPLEVIDVFFTINVYSNALLWLAFAWDVGFVHGGLSPDLARQYLFWVALVMVCTCAHLFFAFWSERSELSSGPDSDEGGGGRPARPRPTMMLDSIDIRLGNLSVGLAANPQRSLSLGDAPTTATANSSTAFPPPLSHPLTGCPRCLRSASQGWVPKAGTIEEYEEGGAVTDLTKGLLEKAIV